VAGIEASYLANALAGQIEERLAWLRILRGLRLPEAPARVVLGSVVGVGPAKGPVTQWYFLLPVCGGQEVAAEEGSPTVRVITPETPLARSVVGRAVGDEIPPVRVQGARQVLLLLL
jgi:transcription elongation GreA/GreB family factor